jgi:hypothetical protein
MTMDDEDVEKLIQGIAAGTVEVDLDVHPYNTGPTVEIARLHEQQRRESLARGERVAYVYSPKWTAEHNGWRLWRRAALVSAEQVKRLLDGGAKWVGPDHQKPRV